MLYIVYVEWPPTRRNHAGMSHLVTELQKRNKKIRLLKIPARRIRGYGVFVRILQLIQILLLLFALKKDDDLFLAEYLEPKVSKQNLNAKIIKLFCRKVRITGLVHFDGSYLSELYSSTQIKKQINLIDRVLVFGSDLKQFLVKQGVPEKKITVTFHYVNSEFYKPGIAIKTNDRIKVICMGNIHRDFDLLSRIISNSPFAEFNVLMGGHKLQDKFSDLQNVKLYRYVSEEKMLLLMQEVDISLSVLKDTVGSNVIVTSMATGLAMVASDVGSIRDYLDDSNSILCKNEKDYVDAISYLNSNRGILTSMKKASVYKSQTIDLSNFNIWFKKYFQLS